MVDPAGSVDIDIAGPLAYLTLNRPTKRNALTLDMWRAIPQALAGMAQIPGVRVIAVRGAGDTFSSGADLGEVLAATASVSAAREYALTVVRALLAIASCPVPTVAAIRGAAAGGGMEVALAADVRLGEPSAYMLLPFTRIGVVPDRFTLHRITALAGPGMARLLLFGGGRLDAERCGQVGLIDQVVPSGALDAHLVGLANSFGLASAGAIARTKQVLLTAEGGTDPETLVRELVESFVGGEVATSARRFLGLPPDEARPEQSAPQRGDHAR